MESPDPNKMSFAPDRRFLMIAALAGMLAVVLGAWGGHGLKNILTEKYLQTFLTGVQYQATHSLALLFTSLLPMGNRLVKIAGWSFTGGILFFSGSLYVLTLSGIRLFGMITPFGGLLFIAGWLCLFIFALRHLTRDNC
jgi:uncharacterized membrane protein YgdD (TMEM256/DUF423 family)